MTSLSHNELIYLTTSDVTKTWEYTEMMRQRTHDVDHVCTLIRSWGYVPHCNISAVIYLDFLGKNGPLRSWNQNICFKDGENHFLWAIPNPESNIIIWSIAYDFSCLLVIWSVPSDQSAVYHLIKSDRHPMLVWQKLPLGWTENTDSSFALSNLFQFNHHKICPARPLVPV